MVIKLLLLNMVKKVLDGKIYAKDKAIETPAVPAQVVIPMSQHFGMRFKFAYAIAEQMESVSGFL